MNIKTCFKSIKGTAALTSSCPKHCLQFTDSLDFGLSDYYRLIYTVLRSTYSKAPPREIIYRNYRLFSEQNFLADLSEKFHNGTKSLSVNDGSFVKDYTTVLDKHAPLKRKTIRGNEKHHK